MFKYREWREPPISRFLYVYINLVSFINTILYSLDINFGVEPSNAGGRKKKKNEKKKTRKFLWTLTKNKPKGNVEEVEEQQKIAVGKVKI